MSNEDELDFFFSQDKKQVTSKGNVRIPVKPAKKIREEVKQNSNQIPLLSMKAFIHNFRKFYKEKTKIKNLLSAPAAKQRNISLKIYHKNYLNTYREVKSMLVQTRLQEQNCMKQFEELAFKDLHQSSNDSTHIYVRDPHVDDLAEQCISNLDQIFMSKESAFFEKRTLIRFLASLLETDYYNPIGYEMLTKHFQAVQILTSYNIQIVGRFIQQFIIVIQNLNPNSNSQISQKYLYFKLVDIAHFLYENKYQRVEVEIVMKFVTKVKQLYNKSNGFDKNNNIDGDQSLNLEFMTLAYNIMNNKDKVSGELITEVLHTLKSILNDHINPTTVERVRKIMEFNLVGDYLHKYFKDLDAQLSNLLTKIEQVNKLITNGIKNIGLINKQQQLEVLLGFMYKVQDSEINSQMSGILQLHGRTIGNLLQFFEGELEEAELKAHNNNNRQEQEVDMPQVKRVLYADDEELKSGIVPDLRSFVDPYKNQSDQPIRRPKILDVNQIQIHRNPQIQEFQRRLQDGEHHDDLVESLRVPQHEDLIRRINEAPNPKDQIIMSQIKSNLDPYKQTLPLEYHNLRIKEVDHDLLYEQEFEKVKSQLNNPSKDQMISHLQSQIQSLRQEVEQQKKIRQ